MAGIYFTLDNAGIFEVTGRHAERYLNNRLTNDVVAFTKLLAGSPASSPNNPVMRAGALNAQGRLEGLFTVLACAAKPGSFFIVCDAGKNNAEFAKALARYRVAEDVQFTAREDLKLIHTNSTELVTECQALAGYQASWSRNRGVAANFGTAGFDLLVPANFQVPANIAVTAISNAEQTQQRILSGEPQFGLDFASLNSANEHESDTPVLLAEIGILDAVSFTKGCYVGQEVVARIDAMGKAPRTLQRCRVEGSEPLEDFSVTMMAERKRTVGEVTTALEYQGAQICFVLIRNDPQILASAELRVGARKISILGSLI